MKLKQIVENIVNELIVTDPSYYATKTFVYMGEKFCVGYSHLHNEFTVWSDDGCTVLDNISNIGNMNVLSNIIIGLIEEWSAGYIRCSECGERIKRSDVGGRYFAGLFCQKCWNNKWCKIEARETYE